MRTDELIHALSADAATPPARLAPALRAAVVVAMVAAAVVFSMLLGVRPNAAESLHTLRFPMKFVVTILLAVTAGALVARLGRPGADLRAVRALIYAAPAVLAVAVATELVVTPPETWMSRLVGHNWWFCMVMVPTLSALPLVAVLAALRRSAPEAPATLGAMAGVFAGAIGATFYAAHCPDDSPLFVATWYTIAITIVAAAGAALGSRLLRW